MLWIKSCVPIVSEKSRDGETKLWGEAHKSLTKNYQGKDNCWAYEICSTVFLTHNIDLVTKPNQNKIGLKPWSFKNKKGAPS